MNILRRYGIFLGIPCIILLLAVGLMLVSTESDDDESSDTTLDLKGATVIIVESPETEASLVPGSPANEQAHMPQSDRQPTNTDPKSIAQLAEIAQQANQQAPARQPDSDKVAKQPALNDLASAPETDPDISNLPPIPSEVIIEAMKPLKAAGQKCYETLQEKSPDAAGKIILQIVFENEDDTSRVQMSEIDTRTTLHDDGLHDCLAEAAATIELPQSPTKLTLFYPFTFKPDDSK